MEAEAGVEGGLEGEGSGRAAAGHDHHFRGYGG